MDAVRFVMTSGVLEDEDTVNGEVALTRSPACKLESAVFRAEALVTLTVRAGVNAGRVCE
jgi:hypothetical protein